MVPGVAHCPRRREAPSRRRMAALRGIAIQRVRILFGPHRRRAGERDDRNRCPARAPCWSKLLTVRHGRTELLHVAARLTHGLHDRARHRASHLGRRRPARPALRCLAKLAKLGRPAAALTRMHEVGRAIGFGLRLRVRGHRGTMLPVGRRHLLARRPISGFLRRHVGAQLCRLGLPRPYAARRSARRRAARAP